MWTRLACWLVESFFLLSGSFWVFVLSLVSLSSAFSVFPTVSLSLQTQRLLQQIPSAPPVSGAYLSKCVCVFVVLNIISLSLCVATLCVCVCRRGNLATLQQSVTVYVFVSFFTLSLILFCFFLWHLLNSSIKYLKTSANIFLCSSKNLVFFCISVSVNTTPYADPNLFNKHHSNGAFVGIYFQQWIGLQWVEYLGKWKQICDISYLQYLYIYFY